MKEIKSSDVFRISENIVARKIEDEFIIIPITSGIGDSDDDMYSLNETGLEIWDLLDGKRAVEDIINDLNNRFRGSDEEIGEDVAGILKELLARKIIEKI